jgi:hypothetical protein
MGLPPESTFKDDVRYEFVVIELIDSIISNFLKPF